MWCRVFRCILFLVTGLVAIGRADGDASVVEQQIVERVNRERARRHLPALKQFGPLSVIARDHSRSMMQYNFFDHVDHLGRNPSQRMAERFPRIIGAIGENIASSEGLAWEDVAARTVTGWVQSPGHRANILNSTFTHIGIGAVRQNGRWIITQNFGSLICEVLDPAPSDAQTGSLVKLAFKYLGAIPRSSIRVHLTLPDVNAKYWLTARTYSVGGVMLTPSWQSDAFSVAVKIPDIPGMYSFQVGSEAGYFDAGIRMNVRNQ